MKNYISKFVVSFISLCLFTASCSSPSKELKADKLLLMEITKEELKTTHKILEEEDSSVFSIDFKPDLLNNSDTLKAKILNSFLTLYISKRFKDEKSSSCSGSSPEFPGSNFTIFEYNDFYTANFNLDSIQYEISGRDGNFKVKKIDYDDFLEEDEPLIDEYDSTKNVIENLEDKPENEATSHIDILVCYTSFTRSTFGIDQVMSRIGVALEGTNLSFENSKIDINANLVGTLEVSYEETVSSKTDVKWAQQDDQIQRVRDSLKADLVVLLTHSGSYAGRVYAIMNQLSTDFSPKAFAVVDFIKSTTQHTFSHELGHLLGCRHNCEKDRKQLPFPYAHGFANCRNTPFRTIMSYYHRCRQPRKLYWSNPDVKIDGVKTGVVEGSCAANTALTLNQTRFYVSRFKVKEEGN